MEKINNSSKKGIRTGNTAIYCAVSEVQWCKGQQGHFFREAILEFAGVGVEAPVTPYWMERRKKSL